MRTIHPALPAPGPDAQRLAQELGSGDGDSSSLSQLLGECSSRELPGGGLLSVLAQQQVRSLPMSG